MKYKIRKIYAVVISFCLNCGYWAKNYRGFGETVKAMNAYEFETINDVETFMGLFKWRKDELIDWTPWVITLFHRALSDDCDGAATMGKWAFGKIGIKAKVINLWGNGLGHAICVTDDHRFMISNNDVATLNPENWKENVLRFHGYLFDTIEG